MLKGATAIGQSPKKFDTPTITVEKHSFSLNELDSIDEYEKISINIKVLHLNWQKNVGNNGS